MKSLLTLHLATLRSCAQLCSADVVRDVSYLTARWEDEGDSFLTITLPKFAKALERGLHDGIWPDHEPLGFKRSKGLPSLFSGFLIRIFHKDGTLLDDPDADCIWAIRQICYLTHKVSRDCTPERVEQALESFVRTDGELLGLPGRIDPDRLDHFRRVSYRLFGRLFDNLEMKIANYELVPKHGPGAVAEGISPLEKRAFSYWSERLERVFPYWRYTRNSVFATHDQPVPIDAELPVKVISVPKTQSTPRIIAVEPSSVQYAQQGLKREIYEEIGRGPLGKVLGFTDQSRNQMLAHLASVDSSLATLDLSEASDRVHWFLVYTMVGRWPHLWDYLHATRSHRAAVPGFGVIPLQKFASMGSALTFPIEAMIFTILAVCGMEEQSGRVLDVRDLPGRLSVYGDDIIIPVDSAGDVVDWLEHFGAKVNRAKSFWKGHFRESCGAEYYKGHDVTVVRLRHELPSSRRDAAEVAALVDFRNRAYKAGLWILVGHLDEEMESLIRLPYSRASENHPEPYLARETFLPVKGVAERFNPHLHRPERRVPVLIPHGRKYRVDGEPGVLEWFHSALRRGDLVSRYDSEERPTSFSIKRRWREVIG
jgi:hypothetical protein